MIKLSLSLVMLATVFISSVNVGFAQSSYDLGNLSGTSQTPTSSTVNSLNSFSPSTNSGSGTVSNPIYSSNAPMYLQGNTLYYSNGTTTTISNPSAYYLAGSNLPVTSATNYSVNTLYQVSTTPGAALAPVTTTTPLPPANTPVTTPGNAPTPTTGVAPAYNAGTFGNTSSPTGIGTINPGSAVPTPTGSQNLGLRPATSKGLAPVFGVLPLPYYAPGGSVYFGYIP